MWSGNLKAVNKVQVFLFKIFFVDFIIIIFSANSPLPHPSTLIPSFRFYVLITTDDNYNKAVYLVRCINPNTWWNATNICLLIFTINLKYYEDILHSNWYYCSLSRTITVNKKKRRKRRKRRWINGTKI